MAQEQEQQEPQQQEQHQLRQPVAGLMAWVQRWNFIERARLERELWDAFERGEPIEQLVEDCAPGFRRDVWSTTVVRIRRIERMMRDQQQP